MVIGVTFWKRRRHPVQERRLLRLGHLDRGDEGVRCGLEHAGAEQEHEIQPALAPVDLRTQVGDLRLDQPAENVEAEVVADSDAVRVGDLVLHRDQRRTCVVLGPPRAAVSSVCSGCCAA